MTGARITVGPPYFDASFNPIMAFALIGMAVGPVLAWRRGLLAHAKGAFKIALAGGILAAGFGSALSGVISPAALAGLGLLGWLSLGIIADMNRHLTFQKPAGLMAKIRQTGLPIWGMWLGHLGMALFLMGALGDGLAKSEATVRAMPGDVIALSDRQYRFIGIEENQGPNYTTLTARLALERLDGTPLAMLTPEKRFYMAERQTTTEASIRPGLSGDDYTVLGDGNKIDGYSLRLYHNPLVSWIWGGAAVMGLGGICAFIGRRRLSPNI